MKKRPEYCIGRLGMNTVSGEDDGSNTETTAQCRGAGPQNCPGRPTGSTAAICSSARAKSSSPMAANSYRLRLTAQNKLILTK